MIVYLDSSVLARAYLADEDGHEEAEALLLHPDLATVTGTLTRVEVSGALVRAARVGRADADELLSLLDADLSSEGAVTMLAVAQERAEEQALKLVREHALRALDAWHLAVAWLTVPQLAEEGEQIGFATRDHAQAAVAERMGFTRI